MDFQVFCEKQKLRFVLYFIVQIDVFQEPSGFLFFRNMFEGRFKRPQLILLIIIIVVITNMVINHHQQHITIMIIINITNSIMMMMLMLRRLLQTETCFLYQSSLVRTPRKTAADTVLLLS